jgi:hypothetical protein
MVDCYTGNEETSTSKGAGEVKIYGNIGFALEKRTLITSCCGAYMGFSKVIRQTHKRS